MIIEEENDSVDASLTEGTLSDEESSINNDSSEFQERADALSDEWKRLYGTIVWVRTSPAYNWWPAIVYDLSVIPLNLQEVVLKKNLFGKKYVIYYYGSNVYDYALPNQIKDYNQYFDEYSKVLPKANKYLLQFQEALKVAAEEINLPIEQRVAWNHILIERKRKRKIKIETKKEQKRSKKTNSNKKNLEILDAITNLEVENDEISSEASESNQNEDDYMSEVNGVDDEYNENISEKKGSKNEGKNEKIRKHKTKSKSEKNNQSTIELLLQYSRELVNATGKTTSDTSVAVSVLRRLGKLRPSIADLQESKIMIVIQDLKRHSDEQIVNEAKHLRLIWKEWCTKQENTSYDSKEESTRKMNPSHHDAKVSKKPKSLNPIYSFSGIKGNVPIQLSKKELPTTGTEEKQKVTIEAIPSTLELKNDSVRVAPAKKEFELLMIPSEVRDDVGRFYAIRLLFESIGDTVASIFLESKVYSYYLNDSILDPYYFETINKLAFSLSKPSSKKLLDAILRASSSSEDNFIDFHRLFDASTNEYSTF